MPRIEQAHETHLPSAAKAFWSPPINTQLSAAGATWKALYQLSTAFSPEARLAESHNVPRSSSAIELASFADIDRIFGIYHVQDRAAARGFLLGHQYLVSLLIDASFIISEHFPGVPIEIHVISDIEIANSERLYVTIDAPGKYRDKLAVFENFEDHWWFKSMGRGRGKLAIDLS